MGQKVNAVGMRIGVNRDWNSKWYANNRNYSAFLIEDINIRKYLNKACKDASISHIEIDRVKTDKGHKVTVKLFVARPGVVIGQDGTNVTKITKALEGIVAAGSSVKLDVLDVKVGLLADLLGKCLLPCHPEEGPPAYPQSGRQRLPYPLLWPSRWCRNRPSRRLQRRRRPSSHHPCGYRLRTRRCPYRLWPYRCQSLDLPQLKQGC